MIQELLDLESQCLNFPITINIEGDIRKIEIIRSNCLEPEPPKPEPPKPEPPKPEPPKPDPPNPEPPKPEPPKPEPP